MGALRSLMGSQYAIFCVCTLLKGLIMKHTFTVTGMTCEHCDKAVVRAVKLLDRSAEVNITRAANLVEVTSDQPREALAQAIADEGYVVAD
jgi:copper chaperone